MHKQRADLLSWLISFINTYYIIFNFTALDGRFKKWTKDVQYPSRSKNVHITNHCFNAYLSTINRTELFLLSKSYQSESLKGVFWHLMNITISCSICMTQLPIITRFVLEGREGPRSHGPSKPTSRLPALSDSPKALNKTISRYKSACAHKCFIQHKQKINCSLSVWSRIYADSC